MNKISIIILSCFATIVWSCSNSTGTEKYQNKRDNTVNVKDHIVEIIKDDLLMSSHSRLCLANDYLIIRDAKPFDMFLVNIFNRNNYEHLTSVIPKGQGPGEITVSGYIAVNEVKKELYMSDHGKLKIFTYPIDSILNNPYYVPEVKKELNNSQFLSEYQYVNDTLSYARIIEPAGNFGHNEVAGKWNMQTGEVFKMKYTHPKINKKRIGVALSMEHETVVECYRNHDLMTIMDLDGNLRYNVYGKNWNNGEIVRIYNFGDVVFRGDKIIASYSGKDMSDNTSGPDKLLIFSLNGDYVKTLDIGYAISDFCYDEQNDRLVFSFYDIIQFGYLQLDDNLIGID